MNSIFADLDAKYREEVLKETWGHLAPEKGKKYEGYIVFAIGCFGSDYLNPTVLAAEFEGLDSSPWFYESLQEFVMLGQEIENMKYPIGTVHRFDGYLLNYQFIGNIKQVYSCADDAKNASK